MALRRPGDKQLSETMLVRSPTHICVTQPQWVNVTTCYITQRSSAMQVVPWYKCWHSLIISILIFISYPCANKKISLFDDNEWICHPIFLFVPNIRWNIVSMTNHWLLLMKRPATWSPWSLGTPIFVGSSLVGARSLYYLVPNSSESVCEKKNMILFFKQINCLSLFIRKSASFFNLVCDAHKIRL